MIMKDLKIIALIEKYQQGSCTPAERILVEEWLESLANTEETFETLKHTEQDAIKQKMHQNIKQQIAADAVQPIRRFNWNNIIKIAASVVVFVSVLLVIGPTGYDIFDWKNESLEVSSVGKTQKIILSDGSIIWLKGNSTLTYPEHFVNQNREVSLKGEALFEVAKDSQHPFIVHSGGMDTRVVGTSFNIRPLGQHIEVVVFTGKVTVSLANSNQQLLIRPSEKAICMPTEKQIKAQENTRKDIYLADTEYNMNFEDAKMSEILSKISAKFDVSVELTDKTVANCLITADFTDQSLVKTFEVLCQILNGSFVIEGSKVYLKAEGCGSN